jgi:hypothetical protein
MEGVTRSGSHCRGTMPPNDTRDFPWLAQMGRSFDGLRTAAEVADAAIRALQEHHDTTWAPYRARWARKRTPKYLAKGGVRK